MATILIIGATGTVGAPLLNLLADTPHTIRAATRDASRVTQPGVTPVVIDLTQPETFDAALEGVQRLFLMSPPGFSDPYTLLAPLVQRAANTPGLERIVNMTAQNVQHSDNPQRRLELLVEETGLDFIHLRPSWFSQNFHTFWGQGIRVAKTLAVPGGDGKVGFIDARDIAACAASALTRDDVKLRQAYELTGPAILTHGQAADVLSEAVGHTIQYQDISEDQFRTQLAAGGLPDDYINHLVFLFSTVRAGHSAHTTQDVFTLTGNQPRDLARYAHDHRQALVS